MHPTPKDKDPVAGNLVVADENTDDVFRYADALETLRQIMVQHGVSGPECYICVDELVPVLKIAENGGSRPIECSAVAAKESVARSVLDKLVAAVMSGSLRRVQKVVRDYYMIFGDEEFKRPEPGTCGQCGLLLEAGVVLSTSGASQVYVCKECGVALLSRSKVPVELREKLWNERAVPEVRQAWEKRKT